eukprot:8125602-Pyramimonas_sp.AAC.4
MVELHIALWNVILLSETRTPACILDLEDGHELYRHSASCCSAGIAALDHRRHAPNAMCSLIQTRPLL